MANTEPTRTDARAGQLALAPFGPGDPVVWHDRRGRRVGRFVRAIPKGPHRGKAEVVIGGTLMPEQTIRVRLEELRPR